MNSTTAAGTKLSNSFSHNDPNCSIKVSIVHLVAEGDDAACVSSDFADALLEALKASDAFNYLDGINIEINVLTAFCRTETRLWAPRSECEFDAATEEFDNIIAAVLARSDWRSDREVD